MPTQVQRDALEAPIRAWVDNNPGTECRRHNGRRQLFDHVKTFYWDNYKKDLKDQKVNAVVSKLLSRLRGGVIMPERELALGRRLACLAQDIDGEALLEH
jgi:hypothetical protein